MFWEGILQMDQMNKPVLNSPIGLISASLSGRGPIFSMVILSQVPSTDSSGAVVSFWQMCTILINRLDD